MLWLLSTLAFTICFEASARKAAGHLIERQATSSFSSDIPATLGWSSAGTEGDSTEWALATYDTEELYSITSSDYYAFCGYEYTATSTDTLSSIVYWSTYTTTCNIYTTCVLGVMSAATTSYQCLGDGYQCMTYLLYDAWGDTDASTSVDCGYISSTSDNATVVSLFRKSPPVIVSTAATTTSPSSSTATVTPAPSLTSATVSSTATSSASSSSGGGSGHSNNAGIIAGATVGGIAVLGAIGVAVLFILKRAKRYEHQQQNAMSPYPLYQPEKPQDQPEYMPGQNGRYSGTTGSPGMHSPLPVYGGELAGVQSPAREHYS